MLNKKDFLDGICGKAVEYEIENLGTILLRSLTVKELREIAQAYENDEIGASLATVGYALVEPKLNKEDFSLLENAVPGTIMRIAKRISELSGLGDESNSPN